MSERSSEKAQRLRLLFARGPEAANIGHLDLSRIWERAFGEAGIAVSYSMGNRPQPRLAIAAGLPMGVTSDGELVDVILAQPLHPAAVPRRVQPHLPPGLEVHNAWEVGMGLPSLPSVVRWSEYEVELPLESPETDVAAAVCSFLAAEQFPWEDTRGEKTRHYDLRPLVRDIRLGEGCRGGVRLSMLLRFDTGGVGRPDQVVKALGLPDPARIHRRRLLLAEVSPARDAWRRTGRYVG